MKTRIDSKDLAKLESKIYQLQKENQRLNNEIRQLRQALLSLLKDTMKRGLNTISSSCVKP